MSQENHGDNNMTIEFVGPYDLASTVPAMDGHYLVCHWCPADGIQIHLSVQEYRSGLGWRDHLPFPDYVIKRLREQVGHGGGSLPNILSVATDEEARANPALAAVLDFSPWVGLGEIQKILSRKDVKTGRHVNVWFGLTEASHEQAKELLQRDGLDREVILERSVSFTDAVRERFIPMAREEVRKLSRRPYLFFAPELDPEHPGHEKRIESILRELKDNKVPERLAALRNGGESQGERVLH